MERAALVNFCAVVVHLRRHFFFVGAHRGSRSHPLTVPRADNICIPVHTSCRTRVQLIFMIHESDEKMEETRAVIEGRFKNNQGSVPR